MDWTPPDALARTERHLRVITRGRERQTLERWRSSCSHLSDADLATPTELKSWLRRLPNAAADLVLGRLVALAQRGDASALLAVIVCLGPGIRSLATRSRLTTDEVVSEIAVGILDFPIERRTSVAGGLLLDARNRIFRAAQRDARAEALTDDDTTHPPAPGELGHVEPSALRILDLVCQAHRQGLLDGTEAELIILTRLVGDQVKPVAQRLGLSPSAAYQRRSRAEARLVQVA